MPDPNPQPFLNLVRGVSLQSLVVVIFEGGAGSARGRRLFSILLTEVTIASLEQSAQDSSLTSVIPTEVVGFRYVKIRLRDDLTGASSCFDFGQNASVNC